VNITSELSSAGFICRYGFHVLERSACKWPLRVQAFSSGAAFGFIERSARDEPLRVPFRASAFNDLLSATFHAST